MLSNSAAATEYYSHIKFNIPTAEGLILKLLAGS